MSTEQPEVPPPSSILAIANASEELHRLWHLDSLWATIVAHGGALSEHDVTGLNALGDQIDTLAVAAQGHVTTVKAAIEAYEPWFNEQIRTALESVHMSDEQKTAAKKALAAPDNAYADRALALANELTGNQRLELRKQLGQNPSVAARDVTGAETALHVACTVLGLATLASLALCPFTGGLGCVAAMPMILVLAHGQC